MFSSKNCYHTRTKEILYKLCIVASAWGPPNQAPNASKCVQICSLTQCLANLRLGFEVGPRTGINVLVISVIHRVRTNPEVKMVMPKGGGLDPGGRADPISPNLLIGFAASNNFFTHSDILAHFTQALCRSKDSICQSNLEF